MASYLTSAPLLLLVSVAVMHYAQSATLSDPADSLVNTDSAKGYNGPYGGPNDVCRGRPCRDCGKCCRANGFRSVEICIDFLWQTCRCIGTAVKPTTKAPEPVPDED